MKSQHVYEFFIAPSFKSNMFTPRKGSLSINPGGSPEFQVQYIGCVDTYTANGVGCTTLPVQKIWDKSPEERFLKHVALTLGPNGIQVKFLENRKLPDLKFDIKDISYCCAQQDIHDRVFAWICKSSSIEENKLECHAVLCSSKGKSQTISLVMSRAFHIAYREWKLEKDKQGRNKDRDSSIRKSAQLHITKKINPQTMVQNQTNICDEIKNDHDSLFNRLDSGYEEEVDGDKNTNLSSHQNISPSHFNIENGISSKTIKSKTINSDDIELSDLDSSRTVKSNLSGKQAEDRSNLLGAAMAQMNIVEEDELSFTENNLAFEECINEEECVDHL